MGRLIVIEGIDGSGKATQAKLLCQNLRDRGEDPLAISFPNYKSDSSAPARMFLAGEVGENASVNAYAASSFYSVDRYITYRREWESDYQAGRIIVADRYTTSNITHQAVKEAPQQRSAFIDWLCDFEYRRMGLPEPLLVIYLDMHPEVSAKLMDKRYEGDHNKKDILEGDIAYLTHCRENALFAAEHLGWQVVRCFLEDPLAPKTTDEIAQQVLELVEKQL